MNVKAVTEAHIRLMQHCIGLDYKRPLHGKYEAYRNYFACNSPDWMWEHLVSIGYAHLDIEENETMIPSKQYIYSLTHNGLEFMGAVTGCKIKERSGRA